VKARVTVTLKSGVLDPQGQAIQGALKGLGFDGVNSVRQGKVFDIDLADADQAAAAASLKTMCEKLLANTVIENYAIDFPAETKPTAAEAPAPVAAPEPPPAPKPAPEPEPFAAAPGDIPIDAKVRRSSAPPPDGADLT